MKRLSRLLPIEVLVICLSNLWPSVASSALPSDQTGIVAKVTEITGDARYETSGEAWKVLHQGDEISVDSYIQTGTTNSKVDVKLIAADNPSTIRISSASVLCIMRFDSKGEGPAGAKTTRLRLIAGQIRISSEKPSDYELFGAKEPIHVATGSGGGNSHETAFVFSLPGAITVLKGVLRVKSQFIKAGEQIRLDTGAVTTSPPDATKQF